MPALSAFSSSAWKTRRTFPATTRKRSKPASRTGRRTGVFKERVTWEPGFPCSCDMPGTKEIRNKIKSVQNTRKITKAMEMVAASKMRKAQERMRMARPYGEKIRNIAAHISHANPEYRHPFLVLRDTVKRVGLIVVTTDKGLCGALNTNLLRMVLNQYKAWQAEGEEMDVCAIGNKGLGFMQRLGANIVSQATHLGDRPQMDKLIGTVKVMLD